MKVNLEKELMIRFFSERELKDVLDKRDFFEIIYDYISEEAFKIRGGDILINSLDYLCGIIEDNLSEKEAGEYFRTLLSQVVSSYNNGSCGNIILLPVLEAGEVAILEGDALTGYFYKIGKSAREKENFIKLINELEMLNMEGIRCYEDNNKLRQYFKSK